MGTTLQEALRDKGHVPSDERLVRCFHCNQQSELVDGRTIYPHRPDLARKQFWLCRPCNAYVGCHKGGTRTFGSPANAELREYRKAAHAAFDPIWTSGEMKRGDAYAWLAQRLGLGGDNVHIGHACKDLCAMVVQVCEERVPK